MDYNEIELEIRKILAEQLNLDISKIILEANLTPDLGMDSFNSIEIVFELEDKFEIKISDADIVKAKTVKDIVDYVVMQINAKGDSKKI